MAEKTKIEWTPIPGALGYFIDREGRVGSQWLRAGLGRGLGTHCVIGEAIRELKPSKNAHGYCCVNFGRGNKHLIHRLVLETFVCPCPLGQEARHLNGDRTDNRLDNLVWGTPKENHADQYRHGTRVAGSRHPQAKMNPIQVRAARTLLESGWEQKEVAALFDVTQPTVSSLANRHHRVTDPQEAA